MNEQQEQDLYFELLHDESQRDRALYDYTVDALMNGGFTRFTIWPESNSNVLKVLNGEVDYNDLPFDPDNEIYKGGLVPEQQDIICANDGKTPLCEAQAMKPCLGEACPLFNKSVTPPVCQEFKIAFQR